jgi:hypothetical protein
MVPVLVYVATDQFRVRFIELRKAIQSAALANVWDAAAHLEHSTLVRHRN